MPADAHRNCRLPGNTTCAMFQLRQNRQQTLLSFNRGTTGDPKTLYFGSSMDAFCLPEMEQQDDNKKKNTRKYYILNIL